MLFVLVFLTLLIAFTFASKKKVNLSIYYILVLAVAVRLLITLLFSESKSQDILSFITVGRGLLYRFQPTFPILYFPFISYIGAVVVFFSDIVSPILFFKLFFTVFDIGVVYLIFLISNNTFYSLLYALNPITILTTNIHGQLDSIPLFFLLLGIRLFLNRKELYSSLALSFAIFTKPWPLLFMLPVIRKAKQKWIFFLIGFFPLVSVLIHSFLFNISLAEILTPIKNYRGLYGYWGISELLKPMKFILPHQYLDFQQLLRRIFLLAFLLFSLKLKFKNVVEGITYAMLFFFTFTPTWGSQWLAWIVPFLILTKPKGHRIFFALATVYLLIVFSGEVYFLDLNIVKIGKAASHAAGIFVWFSVLIMFLQSSHLSSLFHLKFFKPTSSK